MATKKTGKAKAKPTKDEQSEPRLTSDGEGKLPTVQTDTVDYLRPYQYRKGTKVGSKESDPQPGSKAAKMKEKLLEQPRVRILIPRPHGEKKAIEYSVCLNGYRLDFPKNQYIDVPEQVAEIIMDSQQQTEAAILRGQIAGDPRKEAEFNR